MRAIPAENGELRVGEVAAMATEFVNVHGDDEASGYSAGSYCHICGGTHRMTRDADGRVIPPPPGPVPDPSQKRFLDLLQWFFDRLDPIPFRLHTRGVWWDQEASSALGSPNLYRGFAIRLEASPNDVIGEDAEEPCPHPGWDILLGPCPTCRTENEEGVVIQTGVRRQRRVYFRSPSGHAIALARTIPVRGGLPPLDKTLRALAWARDDWEVGRIAYSLARKWPIMADAKVARKHFGIALAKFKSLYREVPMAQTYVRKSDAQLDAEAMP